jgi:hypothetical protein
MDFKERLKLAREQFVGEFVIIADTTDGKLEAVTEGGTLTRIIEKRESGHVEIELNGEDLYDLILETATGYQLSGPPYKGSKTRREVSFV